MHPVRGWQGRKSSEIRRLKLSGAQARPSHPRGHYQQFLPSSVIHSTQLTILLHLLNDTPTSVVIPVLQPGTLRLREVKSPAQHELPSERQSQG